MARRRNTETITFVDNGTIARPYFEIETSDDGPSEFDNFAAPTKKPFEVSKPEGDIASKAEAVHRTPSP